MAETLPKNITSKVVLAPAGSGKTEKLSDRYIELLKAGVKPERILTITFTRKAAAEMKERILKRLQEKNPKLHAEIRNNILKLRIMTIDSFCLALVRRFAPDLGLDPRIEVIEDPSDIWNRAKYDTLMQIAEKEAGSKDYETLMELVSGRRAQGWPSLAKEYDYYFANNTSIIRGRLAPIHEEQVQILANELRNQPLGPKRIPNYSDLFPNEWTMATYNHIANLLEQHRLTYLTKKSAPRKPKGKEELGTWCARMADYRARILTVRDYNAFLRKFGLFKERFLTAYRRAKKQAGLVDFRDLEFDALSLLTENDDWQNILRAFDEHTDHLLVDEFQDTSFLQWAIVNKLTEEWRAGAGAKTDLGINPTIFLVGDDKQSIYFFRGAKVEVFARARNELKTWLRQGQLEEESPKDNFRSLDAIIDFNNTLFPQLMDAKGDDPAWRTRYIPFERRRKNDNPGIVEILLSPTNARMAERRTDEAKFIARRIRSLEGSFTIYDTNPDYTETGRTCQFSDIAILLRQRTHLHHYEEALRNADVPFIVVGGIGFWSEPEVGHVLALLRFLVDPADDLSLYATLRGPLFNVPEQELFFTNQQDGQSFLDRVRQQAEKSKTLKQPVRRLENWLSQVYHQPLTHILETALEHTHAWSTFWEPQCRANIRKLLQLVEDAELNGDHPLRIIGSLGKENQTPESKAAVPTEGRNAVQIMTIHGAKGLQFPVVFLPGLDLPRSGKRNNPETIIEERNENEVWVSHITDKATRALNEFHREYLEKEREEHKRLLYVACTRPRDALFLTGTWIPRRKDTWLEWLEHYLGLKQKDSAFSLGIDITGINVRTPEQIPALTARTAPAPKKRPKAIYTDRIEPEPAPHIESVTRNVRLDYHRYSDDLIGRGEIIHRLLEQISNGLSPEPETLKPQLLRLLRLHGLARADTDKHVKHILKQIQGLKNNPEIWQIIAPRPDARAELPIMFSDSSTVWSGRIDRIIETENEIRIYDYKTFPVREQEIQTLASEYHQAQLCHYAAAIGNMKPGKEVSTYLIFTALPKIIPTGQSGQKLATRRT